MRYHEMASPAAAFVKIGTTWRGGQGVMAGTVKALSIAGRHGQGAVSGGNTVNIMAGAIVALGHTVKIAAGQRICRVTAGIEDNRDPVVADSDSCRTGG